MSILSEFRRFSLRGNVVDLAVGFTVGAAFTTVVKSLVNDLIMPPLGLLVGRTDFSNLFLILHDSAGGGREYATLASAKAAGVVTLNYGLFLNSLVAFLTVSLAMFLIIRGANRVNDTLEEEFASEEVRPQDPSEKKCPYCLSTIPYHASRCPACTSSLQTKAET